MITANHQLPISTQAKLLNISRGTVYYLPKPTSSKDLILMRHIDELHLQHPTMGLGCYAINSTAKVLRWAEGMYRRS